MPQEPEAQPPNIMASGAIGETDGPERRALPTLPNRSIRRSLVALRRINTQAQLEDRSGEHGEGHRKHSEVVASP